MCYSYTSCLAISFIAQTDACSFCRESRRSSDTYGRVCSNLENLEMSVNLKVGPGSQGIKRKQCKSGKVREVL